MTGDYIGQEKITTQLGIAGDLASIGMGAAMGGAIGAIGATVGVLTKRGLEVFSNYIEITKTNTNASYIRARSGNSLNNGSSGTYE